MKKTYKILAIVGVVAVVAAAAVFIICRSKRMAVHADPEKVIEKAGIAIKSEDSEAFTKLYFAEIENEAAKADMISSLDMAFMQSEMKEVTFYPGSTDVSEGNKLYCGEIAYVNAGKDYTTPMSLELIKNPESNYLWRISDYVFGPQAGKACIDKFVEKHPESIE